MKRNGPNWGLAFASGSFLIVWCLGFLAQLPIEVVAVRAAIAVLLGAVVGLLVGRMLEVLARMQELAAQSAAKGLHVDFTVASDMSADDEAAPDERTLVVPAAPIAGESGFQPLDFKQAARHVQSSLQRD